METQKTKPTIPEYLEAKGYGIDPEEHDDWLDMLKEKKLIDEITSMEDNLRWKKEELSEMKENK